MPSVQKQTATSRPKTPPTSNGDAWGSVDDIRMVLYGDSGTGKTTLWGTFPGPIKCLICSGSSRPGELRSLNTPEYRKKISPTIITSTDQLCDEAEKGGDFRTTVLDHASALVNLVCKEHLGLDDIPAVKKWGMAQQRDWGNINDKCIELLRMLLNLQGNVVIVAQEAVFKGKEDGVQSDIIKPAIGPAVTPGIGKWLNPAVDYLVQTFKRAKMLTKNINVGGKTITTTSKGKGTEYCLRCDSAETYMIKFRLPRGRELPELIVDPSYDKIKKLID